MARDDDLSLPILTREFEGKKMKAKDRFEKWIEKFLSFIWKLTAPDC